MTYYKVVHTYIYMYIYITISGTKSKMEHWVGKYHCTFVNSNKCLRYILDIYTRGAHSMDLCIGFRVRQNVRNICTNRRYSIPSHITYNFGISVINFKFRMSKGCTRSILLLRLVECCTDNGGTQLMRCLIPRHACTLKPGYLPSK